MQSFDGRMAEVESVQQRLQTMRTEQHRLFTVFDTAYKQSLKNQTTDAIKKKDEERLFFGIHRYAKYGSLRNQKRVVKGAPLCPILPIRLNEV